MVVVSNFKFPDIRPVIRNCIESNFGVSVNFRLSFVFFILFSVGFSKNAKKHKSIRLMLFYK